MNLKTWFHRHKAGAGGRAGISPPGPTLLHREFVRAFDRRFCRPHGWRALSPVAWLVWWRRQRRWRRALFDESYVPSYKIQDTTCPV